MNIIDALSEAYSGKAIRTTGMDGYLKVNFDTKKLEYFDFNGKKQLYFNLSYYVTRVDWTAHGMLTKEDKE